MVDSKRGYTRRSEFSYTQHRADGIKKLSLEAMQKHKAKTNIMRPKVNAVVAQEYFFLSLGQSDRESKHARGGENIVALGLAARQTLGGRRFASSFPGSYEGSALDNLRSRRLSAMGQAGSWGTREAPGARVSSLSVTVG